MPYILASDYDRAAHLPATPGELNYAITLKAIAHMEGGSLGEFYGQALRLCDSYINRRGLSYTIGNEVMGVLACSGLELMRRCTDDQAADRITSMLANIGVHIYGDILAPYEDGKILQNGDVYPKALVG